MPRHVFKKVLRKYEKEHLTEAIVIRDSIALKDALKSQGQNCICGEHADAITPVGDTRVCNILQQHVRNQIKTKCDHLTKLELGMIQPPKDPG